MSLELPNIIYGTAWKKESTTDLVIQAVQNGFRAVDTACQPKHYSEEKVGDALQNLYYPNMSRQLFIKSNSLHNL